MRFGYAVSSRKGFSSPFQLSLFDPFCSPGNERSRVFSTLDLFAGGGGMSLGLERAGFTPVLLNEFNKDACQTLKNNRPDWNVVCEDISTVDFSGYRGKVDLLSGGPPCQSYSKAGLQKGDQDARGKMYLEFLRAVREVLPRVVLFENVQGMKNWGSGRVVSDVVSDLTSLGYSVLPPTVLNANDYGAAQSRKRLFILAYRGELCGSLQFPEPHDYKPVLRDALFAGRLYPVDVPSSVGYAYSERMSPLMKLIPPGGCWQDLPEELGRDIMGKLYDHGGSTGVCHKLSYDKPCRTLTCSPSGRTTHKGHPEFHRVLNVRECARVQGFPDDWEFFGSVSSQYKQIGNAVAVSQAEALGESIRSFLRGLSS